MIDMHKYIVLINLIMYNVVSSQFALLKTWNNLQREGGQKGGGRETK